MNRFHKPNYISRDLIAKSQIRHLVIFRTARCRCGPPRRGTYLRPAYIYVNGEEIPSVIIIWKEKFRTFSCPSLRLPLDFSLPPTDRPCGPASSGVSSPRSSSSPGSNATHAPRRAVAGATQERENVSTLTKSNVDGAAARGDSILRTPCLNNYHHID